MPTEYEVRRDLRDKAMRRAILRILHEATQEQQDVTQFWPEPMRDDNEIKSELRRILGIRKGLFI